MISIRKYSITLVAHGRPPTTPTLHGLKCCFFTDKWLLFFTHRWLLIFTYRWLVTFTATWLLLGKAHAEIVTHRASSPLVEGTRRFRALRGIANRVAVCGGRTCVAAGRTRYGCRREAGGDTHRRAPVGPKGNLSRQLLAGSRCSPATVSSGRPGGRERHQTSLRGFLPTRGTLGLPGRQSKRLRFMARAGVSVAFTSAFGR